MTVITISREFGSGGDALAQRVSKALGYHLVDKAFISDILCQYGLVEFEEEYEAQPGFWSGFGTDLAERRETMVLMLNQVVRTVAHHGNVVILGRSGYAILADLADVLHVRLQAPLRDRIARVASEQNLSPEDAARLVEEKDKIRTSFIESFYRVPWEATHAFDLAINTALIPVETATDWVIEAAAHLRGRDAGGRPTAKTLEIDPVMNSAVIEKLRCTVVHP